MKLLTLISLFFLLGTEAFAQGAVINGMITDRTNADPVLGVSVRVDGTRIGAYSDSKGRFTLRGLTGVSVKLLFSSVGYEPTSLVVLIKGTETKDIVVTMMPSAIITDQVVVSANKRIQAVQDVPISVSILSQADLADRSITQLDEALKYVSGVSVQGDQVNIRGASGFALGLGSRTAVLLDGMPLLSGDNGDVKFDVLPVADVERIEIIKGAGSALYGTGALGGVVSMFTKPPTKEFSATARGYFGLYQLPKYDEWRYRTTIPTQSGADVRFAQQIGQFSYSASGGVRYDESYREFDKKLRGFGYGKLSWQPSYKNTFTASTLYAVENSQNFIYWRDLPRATYPPAEQNLSERLFTSKFALFGEWQHIATDVTSIVVRASTFRTLFENRIDGVALDSNTSTAYSHNLDGQLTTSLTPFLTLTTGLTGRINHVRSDVYGLNIQSILSGYAQVEYTDVTDWIFTAGLRADREETHSLPSQLELSPKFGASYKANNNINFRASLGRGFRAATIAERYANIRYGPFNVIPNPDILPESSWSAEIGGHYTSSAWILPLDIDLAIFDNELYQLIEPNFLVDQPSVPIVFQNITRARITGLEFVVRTLFTRTVKFETGLTVIVPRDLTTGEGLKYRNNVLWYNRAAWDISDQFELQADYRYMSRIENIDDRLSVFIPDADQRVPVHIVDARFIVKLPASKGSELRLSIVTRNLLNYAYTEYVANLGASRNVLIQIEYR